MSRPAEALTDPRVAERVRMIVDQAPPLTDRQIMVITQVMKRADQNCNLDEEMAA